MMFEDNITKVGKIGKEGSFSIPNGAFYLFVSPIGDAAVSVLGLAAKPCYNDKETECPIVVGTWSPIVFSSVKVTSELLGKYNFYWGTEA